MIKCVTPYKAWMLSQDIVCTVWICLLPPKCKLDLLSAINYNSIPQGLNSPCIKLLLLKLRVHSADVCGLLSPVCLLWPFQHINWKRKQCDVNWDRKTQYNQNRCIIIYSHISFHMLLSIIAAVEAPFRFSAFSVPHKTRFPCRVSLYFSSSCMLNITFHRSRMQINKTVSF